MITTFLQVALGGAIGAMMRYGFVLGAMRFSAAGFPVGVLGVNIIGSFLMGLFVILADAKGLASLSPFVMAGLLGGFTTFSAFSLETFSLIERGQTGSAGLYVILSVLLSVGGLFAGICLARGVLT